MSKTVITRNLVVDNRNGEKDIMPRKFQELKKKPPFFRLSLNLVGLQPDAMSNTIRKLDQCCCYHFKNNPKS